MSVAFGLSLDQGIQADSGAWYRNLQQLGAGGNAVTYLCQATSGPYRGVLFAVKVFRNVAKPERRDDFLRELEFLRGCDHPSIMRVFDSGTFYNQYPFLVAEYLPDTLFSLIRTGQTPMAVRVSFSLQLLSALTELDRMDTPVVHRDIKPRNIFVKAGTCVLGDFGLLKRVGSEPAASVEALKASVGPGMPFLYRTPDLVQYLKHKANLTTKSDVFQLGLVLAELVTGRVLQKPAHSFEDEVELYPLGTNPGSDSGFIATLIRQMLEFDSEKRISAERCLDQWESVFKNAVRKSRELEGRAI